MAYGEMEQRGRQVWKHSQVNLRVQADDMRRWQAAVRLAVANGWGAGLGHPAGEGTCCRGAKEWLTSCLINFRPRNVELSRRHEPEQRSWTASRDQGEDRTGQVRSDQVGGGAGDPLERVRCHKYWRPARKDGRLQVRDGRQTVRNGQRLQGPIHKRAGAQMTEGEEGAARVCVGGEVRCDGG
jgi:hypothetical protein